MNYFSLEIPDVLLIAPKVYEDNRGFFIETMRNSFLHSINIPEFVQHNHSRSKKGVLRGLHYQRENPQGKLVRCSNGKIFDVAVDIRRNSPYFGKYVSAILDDKNHHQLWIPQGFAHGFIVLSDEADFCYSCTNYYHPESELGIYWNDKNININWPDVAFTKNLNISDKDKNNPNLEDQPAHFLPSIL